jgi:hypothetical protein
MTDQDHLDTDDAEAFAALEHITELNITVFTRLPNGKLAMVQLKRRDEGVSKFTPGMTCEWPTEEVVSLQPPPKWAWQPLGYEAIGDLRKGAD